MSEEKKEKEKSAEPTEELKETGSANLEGSRDNHRIKLLTIVGEIEGHEAVSGNTKATKYEHLLPMLAEVEDSSKIDGLLILLNTLGGMAGYVLFRIFHRILYCRKKESRQQET